MSYGYVDSFRAGPGCSILVLLDSEQTPDDRQRDCPKHVEFHAEINL